MVENGKPVKILRIQSRIVVGGPALHTILLSRRLNDDTYQTILVGGAHEDHEKCLIGSARSQGVDCRELMFMRRRIGVLDDVRAFRELVRLIRKERPDIVHTHTAKAGALGRLAAWVCRVPCIVHTYHGHVFTGYFSPWRTRMFIEMEKMLARISTRLVVISPAQKKEITQVYRVAPEKKVSTIPLGFDWGRFDSEGREGSLRATFQVPENRFVIASIGRIVPIKDHRLFVDTACELHRRNPGRYHFMVIGDGDLRKQVQRMVMDKEMDDYFTFTGWLKLNRSHYQGLDLVMLTSRNEGTPVTAIEALAAGVPVVAPGVGGVGDVLNGQRKYGLVEQRRPEAFADAVESVVDGRYHVSQAERERVQQHYAADRLEQDLRKLYGAVLGRG